jgi:hypothetical protein
MIQLIGLVMAAYVFTRAVEIAGTSPMKAARILAVLCAAFTALAAVGLLVIPGPR